MAHHWCWSFIRSVAYSDYYYSEMGAAGKYQGREIPNRQPLLLQKVVFRPTYETEPTGNRNPLYHALPPDMVQNAWCKDGKTC